MFSIAKIKTENDVHRFLNSKGFETNYNKLLNTPGVDIIALKNGESYLIEHKSLTIKESGQYIYSGEINGDILIVSTPEGSSFFVVNNETSMTKTARFVDIINL